MAKFDPFLSLDCARVEGMGRNPRKGKDQGPDSDAKISFFKIFFKNFFAQRRFLNRGKSFKEVFKEANLVM